MAPGGADSRASPIVLSSTSSVLVSRNQSTLLAVLNVYPRRYPYQGMSPRISGPEFLAQSCLWPITRVSGSALKPGSWPLALLRLVAPGSGQNLSNKLTALWPANIFHSAPEWPRNSGPEWLTASLGHSGRNFGYAPEHGRRTLVMALGRRPATLVLAHTLANSGGPPLIVTPNASRAVCLGGTREREGVPRLSLSLDRVGFVGLVPRALHR